MNLETIVAWAKRRWFVYPGSSIYGWLANSWDFGPYGIELKNNIAKLWWQEFVQKRQDIIWLDSAVLMNTKVWEASWHLSEFNDPLIDDKNTGERFRVDKLIEEKIEEFRKKIENNLNDYIKHLIKVLNTDFNEKFDFDEKKVETLSLNEKIKLFENIVDKTDSLNKIELSEDKKAKQKIKQLTDRIKNWWIDIVIIDSLKEWGLEVENLIPESWSFEQMKAFIEKYIPNNPNSWKKADWTDVRKFNLMFKTYQGVIEDDSTVVYLRPETAQWIFVNFKNILDTTRIRVPFGIAQIWKAFRNEITPWNFLYRVREFEQMEIEYFVQPDNDEKYFEKWKEDSWNWWTKKVWIKQKNLRFRDHEKDELSHYSAGTVDIEYKFPWWWWELQWIARRTDFDLKQHQKYSGVSMQYQDPKTGKRYIPYVIEPSWGLTRATLTAMIDAYDEETYVDPKWRQQTRTVAHFSPNIAPVKYAILPLLEKNKEMVEISEKIFDKLCWKYNCELDIRWNIGKRYRRQDEIWTPWCITVDHQTLKDNTVTIRDRDSMKQERVKIDDIL